MAGPYIEIKHWPIASAASNQLGNQTTTFATTDTNLPGLGQQLPTSLIVASASNLGPNQRKHVGSLNQARRMSLFYLAYLQSPRANSFYLWRIQCFFFSI